jgi:glutamate formiminotransferase / 5-formyltetrahydrofolate cyclo-ligase
MSPARLLMAVPNFSEGRDPAIVEAIVEAMRAAGGEILDWSADADHHRCVVTVVGSPEKVENAALAGAAVAVACIDLNRHCGVHPRVGALDVLPFVPLAGLDLAAARAVAHRAGERLAGELGIPVYFYGEASQPPGRPLSALRRGGFEALRTAWPADRPPDLIPDDWRYGGAHPTAGVTCVGARRVLLAWNIFVSGIDDAAARSIAAHVREAGNGFAGVRALALRLPSSGRLQLSMNIENVEHASPMAVYGRVEELVRARGGAIEETEVIGMVPDSLLWQAAADRLRFRTGSVQRMLSHRLLQFVTQEARISQDA